MTFRNCYGDTTRAEAYALLGFGNTYHLAFRDLPAIVHDRVAGTRAFDFGCGTGRSTRFLRRLGFDAIGADIAPEMIARARELDPAGSYYLLDDTGLRAFGSGRFDLVLSAFTFDNIPGLDEKVRLFRDLAGLLSGRGALINLVSTPEIYLHEWASFSTKDYPENRHAGPGDIVRITTTDLPDRRPAEDILCPDDMYRDIYARAGLVPVAVHRPLATGDEPYAWVNETRIAPWAIYVLARQAAVRT